MSLYVGVADHVDRNSGYRQYHLPVLPSLGSRRTSRAVGPEGEGCCHRILIESVMSLSHEIRKAISTNSEEKPGSRPESNSTLPPPTPVTDPSVAGSYPVPSTDATKMWSVMCLQ